ncbi:MULTISPECIES: hypothetical protein [Paenibacillus]|nr:MULTISPECIES: hypothetical protein [Paenibacillus]
MTDFDLLSIMRKQSMYIERLKHTGREDAVEELMRRHPREFA